MSEHIVATIDEIPIGQRKTVQIEGRSIGIFNINGEFYALRNVCPHQGAQVCLGSVGGMTVCGDKASGTLKELRLEKQGEILRCPWHGWEFDIKTGKSIFNPQEFYIKNYPVTLGQSSIVEQEDVPRVETYPTSVQAEFIIVHL
jgi:nitrite reductase (NADH) small subunit